LRNQKEKLKKCAENKTSEEKKLDSHTTCPVGWSTCPTSALFGEGHSHEVFQNILTSIF
jgi:hypothetical protein